MGGQWVTSRELFEKGGLLTNQITQMNMTIQMNECGAQGTLGESGKINAAFVGRVATNLGGKWSLGGEEGFFQIQLQYREKDCASFDGYMYTKDRERSWKWTGHKEAISPLSSCDAECKERDPHLNWNGDTSQYPYCNCVCEAGWEFDASGKSCVPAGTSDINPCEAECKARAPAGQLSHMVWNRDTSQYPYCNCVCDSGYEFDAAGKYCVPIQASGANPSDGTPSVPSGSTSTSGSTGSAEIEITAAKGVSTSKVGEYTILKLRKGDDAVINAICDKALYKIGLIRLIYGDTKFEDYPAIIQYNLVNYVSILGVFCQPVLPSYSSSFDIASSGSAGGSPAAMRLELQQGPIRAEVVNDQVSLEIVTPDVIVSSQGKNAFGVAYDPQSGKSFVAAYQRPIQVQPTGGSQDPFTLESGQEVEISNGQVRQATPSGRMPGEETARNPGSVPEGSQGGCYADPLTGKITCIGSNGEPSGADSGQKNGCYQDPSTGQYVCVDSYGGPEGYQEGSQGDGSQDLCYEDPETGETVCSGSSGGPSNGQAGMYGGCYLDPDTGQYICPS